MASKNKVYYAAIDLTTFATATGRPVLRHLNGWTGNVYDFNIDSVSLQCATINFDNPRYGEIRQMGDVVFVLSPTLGKAVSVLQDYIENVIHERRAGIMCLQKAHGELEDALPKS